MEKLLKLISFKKPKNCNYNKKLKIKIPLSMIKTRNYTHSFNLFKTYDTIS